jgi:hypothetical protein
MVFCCNPLCDLSIPLQSRCARRVASKWPGLNFKQVGFLFCLSGFDLPLNRKGPNAQMSSAWELRVHGGEDQREADFDGAASVDSGI